MRLVRLVRIGVVVCFAALIGGVALAQNQVATGAVVMIPDGTSLLGNNSGPSDRWFATYVSGGSSYVVEALNMFDGLTNNNLGLALFESDGTTDFLVANPGSCNVDNSAAPSLSGSAGNGDGVRCSFAPVLDNANRTRILLIRVQGGTEGAGCTNCGFRLRVRETTVLSRWSVNGYSMFVAVHNPGNALLAGSALYYPDSPVGPNDTVTTNPISLGPLGSIQFVNNVGSLTPNHGSLHVLVFGNATAAAVDANVQSYGFSVSANNFNFYAVERINHGGGNSW